MTALRFLPCGDTALTVEFGNRIDRRLSDAVLALSARLHAAAIAGVVETVPTFRSLLVHYDPLRITSAQLVRRIGDLAEGGNETVDAGRHWRIPACYEDEFAPDLEQVAAATGLRPAQVVALHAGTRYHVYMLGFLPGFPYMGDLPEPLRLPRLHDPRVRVPAGSVAIAQGMTAVYTFESPGGWHLLGRTPVAFFDAGATPPALLRPGDAVSFEPVPRHEYQRLAAAIAAGSHVLLPEPLA